MIPGHMQNLVTRVYLYLTLIISQLCCSERMKTQFDVNRF